MLEIISGMYKNKVDQFVDELVIRNFIFFTVGMANIVFAINVDKLLGDRARIQYKVDRVSLNRALRHHRKICRNRILYNGNAAKLAYFFESHRSVETFTRQQDSNRAAFV